MDHQDAEWAVHRLVMEGLSDLDARSDENWAARVDHLCGVLLRLNPDVGRTRLRGLRRVLDALVCVRPAPQLRRASAGP